MCNVTAVFIFIIVCSCNDLLFYFFSEQIQNSFWTVTEKENPNCRLFHMKHACMCSSGGMNVSIFGLIAAYGMEQQL